ncbi:DUF1015 domain-containing protein [Polaribacter sp. R77954]|uniref:DUF1015 domain-containing protein n=1 Tax=Polaribacter sp. R77954 TaxID=3093870 RepID=UPI0037CB6565
MAIVKPFKAVRPSRDKVALVSSKSYEEYSPAELGAKLDFNPFSFLHIINSGYKHQQEISSEQRFQLVHNRYEAFKEKQIFIQDAIPSFYIYQKTNHEGIFCGIIAATSVNDYNNNKIKKHEATLGKRVQLFENYLKVTGFNAEPVLLTFQDDETLAAIIKRQQKNRPEYEFSTTDTQLHKLWLVKDAKIIHQITEAFQKIEYLYIADGHHRSASSALLAKDLATANQNHTGNEAYNFFMSYLIPESDLKISAFNRFVRDLNGLSVKEFLTQLNAFFIIENKGQQLYSPSKKHHFSMYLQGEFYALYLRENKYHFTDALSTLDAEILYKTVLRPMLGIDDVTHNDRIAYAHNKTNAIAIKTKVDSGLFKVGFGLVAVDIHEMKKISNANLKMPPKTTYIQPKLRSGLTMYEF